MTTSGRCPGFPGFWLTFRAKRVNISEQHKIWEMATHLENWLIELVSVFYFVLRTECMKSNGTKCKTRPMSRRNFHVLLSNLYNVQIGQTCIIFSIFSIRGDYKNLISSVRKVSKCRFGRQFKCIPVCQKIFWLHLWNPRFFICLFNKISLHRWRRP